MKNYAHLRVIRDATVDYTGSSITEGSGRIADVYYASLTAKKFKSPCCHEGFYRIMNYSERTLRKAALTPGYNGSDAQKKDVENIISECENEIEMQNRKDLDNRGKPDGKYMDFCSGIKNDYQRILEQIESMQEATKATSSI
jgi:hypothetical protein